MKILVVGNCQARPVAEVLKSVSGGISVLESIIVHLCKEEDLAHHTRLYEQADVILAQRVADTYPIEHVSTKYLKDKYGSKVVTWVNVFFHGQNPDLFYVTGSDGSRLLGPTDAYHSRTVLNLWKSGVAASEICENSFLTSNCSVAELMKRADKSLHDLQMREENVDIAIHDFILENWQSQPLFHTFNHPNIKTMKELCIRILRHLGLSTNELEENESVDRLSLIVPPFEQKMARELGFKFEMPAKIFGLQVTSEGPLVKTGKRRAYEFTDYIESCYKCYELQKSSIKEERYTPA